MMDVIVVNLVREGINKHRARELAEHFIKHMAQPEQELTTTLKASIHAGLDKKNDKNPQVDHQGKQPEQEPCEYCKRGLKTMCLCGMKAQPEQEPVGEMIESAIYEGLIVPCVEGEYPVGTKLYLAPPQRTWVGLTTEEEKEAMDWCVAYGVEGVVSWISDKLKEKNT